MKKVGSWGLSKRFINLIFFLAVYIFKKKKERKKTRGKGGGRTDSG